MNYKDYLKTEYWKSIREKKLKRRIIKKEKGCQICGEKCCRFNIHHAKYKDKSGKSCLFNENLRFLVVLCEDCHHLYHQLYGTANFRESQKAKIINLMNLGVDKKIAFITSGKNKEYNKLRNIIL